MGIIQPDLGALYRSIAKEIATLALALATTTTTTKEKPEYENMVKHYIIVASVLLGSMLAGHAHAATAPHAGRKLQQCSPPPCSFTRDGVQYHVSVDPVTGLEVVSSSLQHLNDNQPRSPMGNSGGSASSYSAPSTWSSGDWGDWGDWTEWSNWGSWWG